MSSLPENQSQASRFFDIWFHDFHEGFIELRFLSARLPGQKFIPSLGELEKINYGLNYPDPYQVYFGACPRIQESGTDAAVKQIPGLWLDIDAKAFGGGKEEALKRINEFPLRSSLLVDSGNGYHVYWVFKELDNRVELVVERLRGLAVHLNADTTCCNLSRVLRVPGTYNKKNPQQHVQVQLLEANENQYILEDFDPYMPMEAQALPQPKGNQPGWVKSALEGIEEGNRNGTFTKIAGKLHSGGLTPDDIYSMLEPHARACSFQLTELQQVIKSVSKYPRNSHHSLISQSMGINNWPLPLKEQAFYGLAGKFVRLIEPHTESDPAGVLLQFLILFGSIIGDKPHFRAEADIHHCNLFGVFVGDSSRGRKGVSYGQVSNPFSALDEVWIKDKRQSGLSSGEGLIWAVRDAVIDRNPIREKGGRIKEFQEVISDPGITDKRLLIYEAEFASVLRMLERDGNTLSALIRQAWDSTTLQTLTKNSKVKATGPHISIIGNITKDELKRYMTTTEMGNGFGNRFLWGCVKRSKSLPEGGKLSSVNFAPFIKKFKQAYEFGRSTGLLERDAEAKDLWFKEYDRLSEGASGMVGALTARSVAQVMRLACIYALLDCSVVIKRPHLEGALEVWRYAEDSVRYIFGSSTGNQDADTIHKALKVNPAGLTRSQIAALFNRHRSAEAISNALSELERIGKAKMIEERTEGRSREIWVDCETSEISELKSTTTKQKEAA